MTGTRTPEAAARGGAGRRGGDEETASGALSFLRGSLTLALAAGIAYFLVLAYGGFVFDDVYFVYGNPRLASFEGLVSLWLHPGRWSFPAFPAGPSGDPHYMPLLYTTYWLEHLLWGAPNPRAMHAANVVLHTAVCVAAWRLLLRLAVPGAFLAALIFAVHPGHSEAVAMLIGRKDVLSVLLILSALLVWTRAPGFLPSRRRFAAAAALLAGAMLVKPASALLCGLVAVLAWYRGVPFSRPLLVRLALLGVIGASLAALDFAVYKFLNHRPSTDYGFGELLLLAATAFPAYLAGFVWPFERPVMIPPWSLDPANPLLWTAIAAWVLPACLLWRMRERTGRGPLAALAWGGVALAPYLGLANHSFLGLSFLAERYAYLPHLGWSALAAALVCRSLASVRRLRATAFTIAALFVLALAGQTWLRGSIYVNDLVYFRALLERSPEMVFYRRYYNALLRAVGRQEEALAFARRSMDLSPGASRPRLDWVLTLAADDDLAALEAALSPGLPTLSRRWICPAEDGPRKLALRAATLRPWPYASERELVWLHLRYATLLADAGRYPEAFLAQAEAARRAREDFARILRCWRRSR